MTQNSRIIGLTGATGAGKGVAAAVFELLGGLAIYTDDMARGLIMPGGLCYAPVIERFGTIDRKRLGDIVFNDKVKLLELNAIIHPVVKAETTRIIKESGHYPFIVIDAPVLHEADMAELCDVIIGIFADRDIRLRRIMQRDNIDAKAAERRINSQADDETLMQRVDKAIYNNGSLADFEIAVRGIII